MNYRTPEGEPDEVDRANLATFADLWDRSTAEMSKSPYTVISDVVYMPSIPEPPPGGFCEVYWGSHGCHHPHGHPDDVPHECDCCECGEHHPYPHWPDTQVTCVARAPYYGPETLFYGEDATPETVGRWGNVVDADT